MTFSFTHQKDGINSSFIDYAAYDKPTKTLYVEFDDSVDVWKYTDVPVSVWNNLVDAPSLGRAYGSTVRGKYTSVNIGNAIGKFRYESANQTPPTKVLEVAATEPATTPVLTLVGGGSGGGAGQVVIPGVAAGGIGATYNITNLFGDKVATANGVSETEIRLPAKSKVTFLLDGKEYSHDSDAYTSTEAIEKLNVVADVLSAVLVIKKVEIEFV